MRKKQTKKDENKNLRDSIPKQWVDICDLIPRINYTLVEEFYTKEYRPSIDTWKKNPETKNFSKWLEEFYNFIKVEMPRINKEILSSTPDVPLNKWFKKEKDINSKSTIHRLKSCEELFGKSYQQVYGKSLRLEEKLRKLETKFLKELIDYRFFFWT